MIKSLFCPQKVNHNNTSHRLMITVVFLQFFLMLGFGLLATAAGTEADTQPPTVIGVDPPDGTTAVSVATNITASFNESMNATTINGTTFTLNDGSPVAGVVSYDESTRTATFNPDAYLNYSTTYTATVTTGAQDLAGNGLSQDYVWTFTTEADPAGPPASAPKNVLARGIASTEIAVNWVPVDGATGYRVYRDTLPDGSFSDLVGQTEGNLEAYFVNSGLPSDTPYYYQVSAFNTYGETAKSINYQFSYTKPDGQQQTDFLNQGRTYIPASPHGVVVEAGVNGSASVTITWTASPESNIAGYNIYRAQKSGAHEGDLTASLQKINASLVTGTSYVDNTVEYYLDYYYKVAAVTTGGVEGFRSPDRHKRVEALPPVNVPHIDYTVDNTPCARCHSTHASLGQDLVVNSSQEELCFSCHDGTGSQNIVYQDFNNTLYFSRHPVPAGGNPGTMNCSSCHNPHLDYTKTDANGNKVYPKILRANYGGTEVHKGNEVCYACHGVGSAQTGGDHETGFLTSAHNVVMPDPASGTNIKCITCHEAHASPQDNLKLYMEEDSCFACHYNGSNELAPDIYDRIHSNPDADMHHDVLYEDQELHGTRIECVNCHNIHSLTAQYKTVNPDSPTADPADRWTGTAEPSVAQPLSGTINDFCIKCHDGALPTAVQTAPYAPAPLGPGGSQTLDKNIRDTYYKEANSGILGDTLADKHGEEDGRPKNFDSSMGYSNSATAPNYIMACNRCHEPHGTLNAYNLRDDISSVDGTKVKRGLLAYKWVYLDAGATVTGVDARFFCNGCHGRKHMGNNKSFPNDCFKGGTGCHSHSQKF